MSTGNNMTGNIRIGIDVGGTFTHAVALDGDSFAVLFKVKVPTTHRAATGVAQGVVESLQLLLAQGNISPSAVRFIAHSTTQATNALLEGDVAPVGILGMGHGNSSWLSRHATKIKNLRLAPDKYLKTYHQFLDTGISFSDEEIASAIKKLVKDGAIAIAISESFSVDNPDNENRAVSIARKMGLPATSGAEISQLYGLKSRTITAVINASMLPKMIESANLTEKAVREAGIQAPIMIMRSDGGVMDIESMRQRPILSLLSGPAAGVAAALMYLQISDGIFLEVGGTSTDISAIANGRAIVRSAEVGGHRILMHTLDIHTVGAAGGSMVRVKNKKIIDVGPRSAHLAGLGYAAFSEFPDDLKLVLISPTPEDPSDYLAFSNSDNKLCLTPTCAANFLKLVPDNDCAHGNINTINKALKHLSKLVGGSDEDSARTILKLAASKCLPVVNLLLKEYKLDHKLVKLIGGGGGAAAIVPFLAEQLGMHYELAVNADVISAVGVALALLRETVERYVVNPDSQTVLQIRQQAQAAVCKMGAEPDTVEVFVEIDTKNNIIRATATGATSATAGKPGKQTISSQERLAIAAASLGSTHQSIKLILSTSSFEVYQRVFKEKQLFGLFQQQQKSLRVLDYHGVVRFQVQNGEAVLCKAKDVETVIGDLIEEHAHYGDAGKVIPGIILLPGTRIVDLSGLLDTAAVIALARVELSRIPEDLQVGIIAKIP